MRYTTQLQQEKPFDTSRGSFFFKWPRFSEKFHTDTKHLLDTALNKGPKPPIIEDRIEVVELEMGTQVIIKMACLLS